MTTKAVEVRVTGLVQGVFFRAQCAETAARLGVTGWVSNEYDGSVRGHFEGQADAVDALVAWCRRGSRRASVDRVEVAEARPEGHPRFETR
ncbi:MULTISPECIES: acylphosphatase [Nocardioides]|uniref:acylphosphatase n=1 Tax=Nocardioides vastitatis TaxID=2568655 RepID=A0ABW0ZRE9_9ACTN|nr:acylphosphatase [Nocardioides sp.]THI97265.1 acylphosphatase [Nocardioides sp.]